jgi:protein tyrosine/serine phosphatase
MNRLHWPDCENVRDLGGTPTTDGRTIRPGALIRADTLHRLTPEGVAALRTAGVARVLDLRGADECKASPSPLAAEEIYRFQPIEVEQGYDHRSEPTLVSVYLGSLRRNASYIAAAVGAIADAPDGAVVVHCGAGKDRTGMIVALALAVAGVSDDEIAADYAYTQVCLQARLDAMLDGADDPAWVLEWKGAAEPTIRAMLDHLDSEYGGTEAYLRAHGVTAAQIDALRQRLIG